MKLARAVLRALACPVRVQRTACNRRAAGAYVYFLGTALLVTVIGLSALSVVRVERRAADTLNNGAAARQYAQSAVEQAVLAIHADAAWRTRITHGAWTTPQVIGLGSTRWKIVDPLYGNFLANRNATVRVYGQGNCGAAVWVYSVAVQPLPESVPANLLGNGDLEAGGTTPWASYGGCALQLNLASRYSGAASLRVMGRAAGSAASQPLPALSAGTTYRSSAWVQMAAGTENVWLGVWVQTSAGWQYSEFARVSVGTTWKQVNGAIAGTWDGPVTSAVWVVGTDGTGEFNVDGARLAATPSSIGVLPGTWRREAQ